MFGSLNETVAALGKELSAFDREEGSVFGASNTEAKEGGFLASGIEVVEKRVLS